MFQNPFTSRSDQCQISPASSPKIVHHTVRRTGLFIADSDERWLYYQLSLPHTFSLLEFGRMYFLSLGVKGLNAVVNQSYPLYIGRSPLTFSSTCNTGRGRQWIDEWRNQRRSNDIHVRRIRHQCGLWVHKDRVFLQVHHSQWIHSLKCQSSLRPLGWGTKRRLTFQAK